MLKHKNITKDGEVYFYYANCKGNKEIKKEFPEYLVSYLNKLKEQENKSAEDYIFTSQYTTSGKPLSNKSINNILNFYYSRVNNTADKVTVHSIRNLSAYILYDTTKDILKTKEALNHSSLDTTHRYLAKLYNKRADYYEILQEALNE